MTQRIHPVRLTFMLPLSAEKSVERFVHVYIVEGEQLCVVDTGPAPAVDGIAKALADMGRSIRDVDVVINTHEHPDHIGGNAVFAEEAEPAFICHEKATRWIEDLETQRQERPVFGFYDLAGKAISVTETVQKGDEIDLGGTTLRVIHTPGHSPGSTSLLCLEDGTLITADTVQPVGGLPLYTDVDVTRASMERLRELPDVKTLYRSHSKPAYTGSEIPAVLQAGIDYLDEVDAAVQQALEAVSAEAEPEAIAREALRRLGMEPPPVIPIVVTSIMAHVQA